MQWLSDFWNWIRGKDKKSRRRRGGSPMLHSDYVITRHVYDETLGLELTVAWPKIVVPSTEATIPWVLWINGGGWQRAPVEPDRVVLDTFAMKGVAIITVDYRTLEDGPDIRWPQPREDIQRAMSWLVRNEMSLDPSRFLIGGASAGAFQAMWAGADLKPLGVFTWAGPFSLDTWKSSEKGIGDRLFGRTAEAKYIADPTKHVTKDWPPAFLLHGYEDDLVYPVNSYRMKDALLAAGVECQIFTVLGRGHQDMTLKPSETWVAEKLRLPF